MFLIPYDTSEILTQLRPELVSAKLEPFVGPRSFLEYFTKPKYEFGGRVQATNFRIHRHIAGRNSYLPVIRGEITAAPGGTIVRVSFGLHWAVILFISAMIGWSIWSASLVPAAMVLGMHIILYFIGYLPEKNRAEHWLRKKLQTET